ncbi:hypothetical protein CGZ90_00665 [Fictibacillus aquaticus]|uniref:IstB-like ATP-binding domain-containing protein n=2 Tax=Fictibacillus aquaticus TaxID=2021314 RepID=A0A235FAU4_9BACL|nr:hypothetical protein CGZ90_00665 [Fictibacillus aquaticus]
MSDSLNKPMPVLCPVCQKEYPIIQIKHPITGEDRWVICACQCDIDKLDREKQEQENYLKKKRIQHALRLSSSLEDIRAMTFENLKMRNGYQSSVDEVKDAVLHFDERGKQGLFLFGETGNGKSHITAAGANALIERGYSVVFMTEKDLLNRFNSTKNFNNKESFFEIMDACVTADLLVWDDFMSSQKLSLEEKDWIFQIINGRERGNRPIWATSNLTPQEFESDEIVYKLDDKGRTWWRIIGNMNCIYNRATNYRKARAMAKVLGISIDEYERKQADGSQ